MNDEIFKVSKLAKRMDGVGDYIAGAVATRYLSNARLPVVSPLAGVADLGGVVHGLAVDDDPRDDAWSYFPGVGVSREIRAHKKLSRQLGAKGSNVASEHLGTRTGLLTGAAVGAGAAHLAGAKDPLDILAAGVIGAMTPKVLGSIGALLTPTRTSAEQKAYDDSVGAAAANWMLPGAAEYNLWKTRGHMLRGK